MIAATLLLSLFSGGASEPELSLLPATVHLEGARDRQRFLVLGTHPDGTTVDLTGSVELTVAAGGIFALEDGALVPLVDGQGELQVAFGEHRLSLPVTVSGAGSAPPRTFGYDVLPVLTARGCNTGACHGSSRGQDGFHLSLFGFDPEGDHRRLTFDLAGRRVDPFFPERSLLLEKATGTVAHTGGRLFERGDRNYTALLEWIEAGTPPVSADAPTVTELQLFPAELVLNEPGAEVGLVVQARYSDGTDRDVTDLALLRTNNSASAALTPAGRLRAGVPGEAFVTAAFGTETVGSAVIVLPAGTPAAWSDPAEGELPATWIDELVEAKLRKLRVPPSVLCTDEQFVRRAYLDLVGSLPTPDERMEFLSRSGSLAERRSGLVQELLATKEFRDQWVMRFAELLRIRSSNTVPDKAARAWFEWLSSQLEGGARIDTIVRRLLTASGGTFAVPETNYFRVEREANVMAENAAQAFLGLRVQCAQCHNHPFDRWTQDDYYGFVAFFGQIGLKSAEDPAERVVYDRRSGGIRHPVSGQTMAPKLLGGEHPDCSGRDRRAVLADWVTSPDNPWFARNFANRVWAAYLGRGIVEPVDDMRVSNPPSNAALLDALAERLIASDYDLAELVHEICTSRVYQRASRATPANERDDRNFAWFGIRRLRAEVLADTLGELTAAPYDYPGLPPGMPATQLADGAKGSYFLTTFGRAPRLSVCACEVSAAPSLSQALHLLNGATVHERVRTGGVVQGLLERGLDSSAIISELFRRALVREPAAHELESLLAAVIEGGGDRRTALEDVYWALLTSNEFLFQH